MNRYLKFIFIALIIFIVLFSNCLVSFAAGDWSFYLTNTDYTLPSGTSIVHVTAYSPNYDQLTCSQSNLSSSLNFFFALPSNLIVGQTYILSLSFYRTQGSNASFILSDSPDKVANNFHDLYTSEFASMGSYNSWQTVNISFVYTGNHYLVFFIRPTSAASNGTFTLRVRELVFNRYNPNAALESAVDEQNSRLDEQNSRLNEQNSLVDEQNSLIDEQNSQLFDGSEEYTGYEDALDLEDSILERFQYESDDLLQSASDIINSERLQKGVLSLTYFFNLLWSELGDLESFRWIRLLVYLSVTCSVLLLILHSGLVGSNKGGKKGD